jgi:hypothetical protein
VWNVKVIPIIIYAVGSLYLKQFYKYLEDIPGKHSRVRIAEDTQNSAHRGEDNDAQVAVHLIPIYFPRSCYVMILKDTISP